MRAIGYLIAILIVCCSSFGQSADSLLSKLSTTNGSDRIPILHDLILELWLNYPEQAMEYGLEAFELANKNGDSVNISKSLRLIGGIYYNKGDYEVSLDYNIKALNIGLQLNDSSLINNGYNNIGLVNYSIGSYQVALEYLLRAKSIKNKIGQTYGLSSTLNNIGLIYDHVEDFEQARNYFRQAYDASIKYRDRGELYALNNVGITYLKEMKLEAAMDHFREALKLSRKYENVNWGSVSLRGIGEILIYQNQLDSALIYCQRSLEASLGIEDKKGIAEAYQALTKYAIAKNDYQKGLEYLDRSQEYANQIKLRQHLLDNLKLYVKLSRMIGDDAAIVEYQEQYLNLRDSLYQDIISRNLALIPIKLKEEADEVTLTQQQSELQNKSFLNRFYVITLLISVPLILILIVLLRKNLKAHKELVSFNEELQRTQKMLITSEKMASLGIMAAGIAHEINNPLNFIKNGVEALEKKIEEAELDKSELEPLFKIVNQGVVRSTNIVKSLSHFSHKSPEMKSGCKMNEIIENCLLILHNKIKDKVRIVTDFTKESATVKGNEGRLHQAMLNVLSNAEQAIEKEGTIRVITSVDNITNIFEIMIEDDGVGISEEHMNKISDPFFTTKAPGEGTGLGLFITFSIIDEHNGHIDVISNPGKGTVFIITLPIE